MRSSCRARMGAAGAELSVPAGKHAGKRLNSLETVLQHGCSVMEGSNSCCILCLRQAGWAVGALRGKLCHRGMCFLTLQLLPSGVGMSVQPTASTAASPHSPQVRRQ